MKASFQEGCKVFLEAEFWKAHEVWEQAWRVCSGDEKVFLKAWIQTAALGLKLQSTHQAAAERLRQRVLELAGSTGQEIWDQHHISQSEFCFIVQKWAGAPDGFRQLLQPETHARKQ